MNVHRGRHQAATAEDAWDPPDTSSAVLVMPLNHAQESSFPTIEWTPGVLCVVLPGHSEGLQQWAELVTNENDRRELVSPGPGAVLYPSAEAGGGAPDGTAARRMHHLLPKALDLGGLTLVALEFLSLPRTTTQPENGPGCAVLALHLTFPRCDGPSNSLVAPLERLRELSYWDPAATAGQHDGGARNEALQRWLPSVLPTGWEPPDRGTRLGLCTLLLERDAARDARFQAVDWMYLAIASRPVRPESVSVDRRASLRVRQMSTSWTVLVMRDGISVLAASDDFTESLRAYFHSVYLDAVLLSRLQALRATELAALVPTPELTDVVKLRELEGAVLDFRRRIWWSYLTGKRTSPGDFILNSCQDELRLADQVASLAVNAADAARLSSSLHQEALTKVQDLTRAAQERTNETIQFLTVLLAPLALSYAAFTVLGGPDLAHFLLATAIGLGLTAVAWLVLRIVRKRHG
ncbi:hypothetical protein AL755_10295 [Arthrobacter sp. ERGS1:01]|uniref:hypothetical protein n=1 Tax=Arthrobacter sp. ERGS1:01 TaxID=1704044 RepID=UPI0006B51C8F|nr:hypothetical protein [Arthrobacter sp. ERGS1:01]ALE05769.1 hypothetical protein AL755_10295 [Arthrobacter sp. ERGS1:01]